MSRKTWRGERAERELGTDDAYSSVSYKRYGNGDISWNNSAGLLSFSSPRGEAIAAGLVFLN